MLFKLEMATSENPFPLSEKSARKQKGGNSYYSGIVTANK